MATLNNLCFLFLILIWLLCLTYHGQVAEPGLKAQAAVTPNPVTVPPLQCPCHLQPAMTVSCRKLPVPGSPPRPSRTSLFGSNMAFLPQAGCRTFWASPNPLHSNLNGWPILPRPCDVLASFVTLQTPVLLQPSSSVYCPFVPATTRAGSLLTGSSSVLCCSAHICKTQLGFAFRFCLSPGQEFSTQTQTPATLSVLGVWDMARKMHVHGSFWSNSGRLLPCAKGRHMLDS